MNRSILVAALCAAMAGQVQAQTARAPVLRTAAELEWRDVAEPEGASQVALWGGSAEGDRAVLVRWPFNTTLPATVRAQELHLVVLAGTVTLDVEGQSKQLGPGGFARVPEGVEHALGCAATGTCTFVMHHGSGDASASSPPAVGMPFTLSELDLGMVWIEPGTFMLGSPADESNRGADEGPQTRVTLSRGYWIGTNEVTQAQWQAVMGTNPSRFRNPAFPVEQISWSEAMAFAERVTRRERAAGRLPEKYAYTLPTEAQWEYAAKAGANGAFSDNVDDSAWHDRNSGGSTHPVGTKQPNAWGLYDTLGNVWEWCSDWYAPYPGGEVVDYAGPPTGTSKASRGGSWWAGPRGARPANRYRDMPQNGNDDLGFRLALVPVAP